MSKHIWCLPLPTVTHKVVVLGARYGPVASEGDKNESDVDTILRLNRE